MPFADDQERRELAGRIERDNPRWLVVWGVYTREFVAFPLFRVPPGTVLCSRNFKALAARMQQVEFRFSPPAGPEGDADAGARV